MLEIEIKNKSELEQLNGFEIENGMMMMTDRPSQPYMVTTRSFGNGKKVWAEKNIASFFFF